MAARTRSVKGSEQVGSSVFIFFSMQTHFGGVDFRRESVMRSDDPKFPVWELLTLLV